MSQSSIEIRAGPTSHFTLSLNGTSLSVQKTFRSKPTSHHEIEHRYILRAQFKDETRSLSLAYLAKKNKTPLSLVIFEGEVEESAVNRAEAWVEALMQAVYDDIGLKRSRRFMVFVNPYGGTKKGAAIFAKKVEPIFKASGCSLEVLYTSRQGHAHDVCQKLPLEFDAVITVSGDGLIHEVLNGFAKHTDPVRALATPVAPIPTGSGNGLSLNLLGIGEGFDVVAATLNAIKGQPMKVDLFSMTQGGRRSVSFMSQAVGLMADLDIGTDNLRWMGETRFIYGLLRGLLRFKPCPVQLSLKLAETDKEKMAAAVHSRETQKSEVPVAIASSPDQTGISLSPHEGEDGWTIFDEPILYVYAGKGPYVARDFMAFPVSLPNDGLIDVMAMTTSSRGDLVAAMDGAPRGRSFWHPSVHYVKAHAYKIKPLKAKGYLSVDGEPFPFEEFQVEVHQGMGTLLSLYGHYAARPELQAPASASRHKGK